MAPRIYLKGRLTRLPFLTSDGNLRNHFRLRITYLYSFTFRCLRSEFACPLRSKKRHTGRQTPELQRSSGFRNKSGNNRSCHIQHVERDASPRDCVQEKTGPPIRSLRHVLSELSPFHPIRQVNRRARETFSYPFP